MNSFLNGYNNIKELDEIDKEFIYIFFSILEIWVMGLHTSSRGEWGIEWLDDEYFYGKVASIKKIAEEHGIVI